tara:strand:+ start:161 stop:319 length:159 start_codon:yes stop_codon:yes gene_type:complete
MLYHFRGKRLCIGFAAFDDESAAKAAVGTDCRALASSNQASQLSYSQVIPFE